MALHEMQVSEGIVFLEYEVFLLRETLNYVLENADIANLEKFDEARLKRQAAKYIKKKYPDEDIKFGDWIE